MHPKRWRGKLIKLNYIIKVTMCKYKKNDIYMYPMPPAFPRCYVPKFGLFNVQRVKKHPLQ